jgi:general secretion pathway protein L
MPQRILGVDLGSWSVKAVLIETGFRGFDVVGVREVKLRPRSESGSGLESREAKLARQMEALKELLADHTFRADAHVIGFPGEETTARFIQLPFSDAKRVELTLAGELADSLPFEVTEAVFDHAIVQKLEEGASLSLAGVARKETVDLFLRSLQAAGIDPKFVPVDVFQLYNLYTSFLREDLSKAEAPGQAVPEAGTFVLPMPGGPPDARLVIDIGHERTLLAAASEQGLAYVRVIRAGGKDVTEAISKAYGISFEDAEEGKHADALVASSRHPAPTDVAQRMSEVVADGLSQLVKEIRRSLQAIRTEKRVRVARIDVLGGTARIPHIANWLAEQLNVPVANGVAVEQIVDRHLDLPRRPAYAAALAYALRTTADATVSRIDLRVGEFQFAGQLRHLRQRAPMIALAAGILVFLLGVNTFAQYHVITKREKAIDQQFCDITQKVIGKPICEPAVAISVMKQPQSDLGSFKLPERSAVRVAAELSDMIPKGMDVWVNELEITNERARVAGEAASFDAVDQIVGEYSKDACYQDIKKSKLRKKSDGKGVEFQLSIKLGCS